MQLFGYVIERLTATDPNEPCWSNTLHGNRHHRIVSLEKVVSHDNLVAYALYLGRYQFRWAKLAQHPASQPGRRR